MSGTNDHGSPDAESSRTHSDLPFDTHTMKPPIRESRRRKWARRLVIGSAAMIVGAMLGAYGVYRSIHWIPNFYAQKLTVDEDVLAEDGRQMEADVRNLHGEVQDEGHWEATFSEDEINGWLAVDLKKKFPRMLPRHIREPRVSFTKGLTQLACQYDSADLQAVLSLDVDVYMTDEPNVVAVRIKRARIGAVPGLLQLAMGHISNAAVRARIPLRWTEQDGDPLALVTIPDDIVLEGHRVHIEELNVDDGAMHLVGRSEAIHQSTPDNVTLASRH